MLTANGGDAVADFVARWSLEPQVADFLHSLDENVLVTVLNEFLPREGTNDIAGKLYAFARSVAGRVDSEILANAGATELDAFAQRWSLESGAVTWLQGLPREVLEILMQEFDPKEDTNNVWGKLRSFAQSIMGRLRSGASITGSGKAAMTRGGGGCSAATERYGTIKPIQQPVQQPVGEQWQLLPQKVLEFAAHWCVEDNTLAFLQSLPLDVQATVINEFDPRGDTKNLNGKLCAFARSIASGRSSLEVVESFAVHWGLDESTKQYLFGLPEEVRAIIIQEFDPKPGTNDVSGKLKMFARGVASKTKPSLSRRTEQYVNPQQQTFASPSQPAFLDANTVGGFANTSAFVSADDVDSSDDPEIQAFVERWGLDGQSVALLQSLPDDTRQKVLIEFEPRANTRDVYAKLKVFAHTVLTGQGRGASASMTSKHAPMADGDVGQFNAPMPTDEEIFLHSWNLADSQQAQEVLFGLRPHVRARVMQEFDPGKDTQSVLGKFCGFASSVARAAAKESIPTGSGRNFSGGSELRPAFHGRHASLAHSLPPLMAPGRGQRPRPNGQQTAAQFAARWGLDEGSLALLRGLEPNAQAAVIAEFEPRGDTKDTSGKFCAFARSVASRVASGGLKRSSSSLGQGIGSPKFQRMRY